MLEVYIVYEKGYREETFGYPQGIRIEIIEEIVSVRATEDAAKEDVKSSMRNLNYIKKILT
jgi:hypothetical protein